MTPHNPLYSSSAQIDGEFSAGTASTQQLTVYSKAQQRARNLFDDVEAEFEMAAASGHLQVNMASGDSADGAQSLSELATSSVETGAMGILRQARLNLDAQSRDFAERMQLYYTDKKAAQRVETAQGRPAFQGSQSRPVDVVDVVAREMPLNNPKSVGA